MRVLILDNYDSFTYNLVNYVQTILQNKVDVYRNDAISLNRVAEYSHIILSPGPGLPKEAGILMDLLEKYATTKKILGVCLGHQAIGLLCGAVLLNTKQVHHGLATSIQVHKNDSGIFKGLPSRINVGRYHSWVIEPESLPPIVEVTASTADGTIMAIEHSNYALTGVQFHPESVLTQYGMQMVANWLGLSLPDNTPPILLNSV